MALLLIYMKSNNEEIAKRIRIPKTIEEINKCDPSKIILKQLTKNLILFD